MLRDVSYFPTIFIQMKQLERQKEVLQTENEALKQRERFALIHNISPTCQLCTPVDLLVYLFINFLILNPFIFLLSDSLFYLLIHSISVHYSFHLFIQKLFSLFILV